MKKQTIAGIMLVLLAAIAVVIWLHGRNSQDSQTLTLYGNVDIRQVSLAFEGSGRILSMQAEEGDSIAAGQVVAVMDTRQLHIQEQQAIARLDAEKQTVREQQAGARPAEIVQAKAELASANAQLALASQEFSRIQNIGSQTAGKGISQQEKDTAVNNLKIAQANVTQRQAALELMLQGVRKEQRDATVAQVKALEADLQLVRYQISQATLRSPVDAIVRSRLQEPGDMTTSQKAVYTLALNQPKWVRVWVSEANLGKVKSGMKVQITTDSFPDRPVIGRIGYISSVAEFTPKSVQTEELRSSLVYEMRITVLDPDNVLRMGQPATVIIPLSDSAGTH